MGVEVAAQRGQERQVGAISSDICMKGKFLGRSGNDHDPEARLFWAADASSEIDEPALDARRTSFGRTIEPPHRYDANRSRSGFYPAHSTTGGNSVCRFGRSPTASTRSRP